MTPDAIRTHKPTVLTEQQREAYFETGFLAVEGLIPDAWLRRLIALSDAFVDESRGQTVSGEAFDLGPRHSADYPHVRRLRAKLGPEHEALIGTVRNVGYKAVRPARGRSAATDDDHATEGHDSDLIDDSEMSASLLPGQ